MRFYSWKLLCEKGGNAAHFFQKLLGYNVGEMLPLFSPKKCFGGYAIIFLEIAMRKRGKCCPFFPKIFGKQCRGNAVLFMRKRGKCCPFFPQNWDTCPFAPNRGNPALFPPKCLGVRFDSWKLLCKKRGNAAHFFQNMLGYNLTFALLHYFFVPNKGEMLPLFPKMFLGVRFDSWNLLCKTGGNAAHFFRKIIGIQFYFHSYSFLLCSKQGANPTLSPKKLRRAIWLLKPAMQNRGKCCPFFQAFWVYNATCAPTQFYCSKTGGNAALFCSENLGVRFDSWNLLCKPGEMLPILCKQFGYTMWLRSYSFLCSKTGEMLPFFFKNFWGVWFDSWSILCNTGGNTAHFHPSIH